MISKSKCVQQIDYQSLSINEGVNVELNRELLESSLLLIAMAIAITILLWFSLRRASDVVIVGATLLLLSFGCKDQSVG